MFKVNSTARLKATQVKASENRDSFHKKLSTFELGRKCIEAAKKAEKQNDRSFEVVFEVIKLKTIPTEKQLKQAGAELAYGDVEENGTKEISVTWTYADGFPGVFFTGKNAAGKEQDASNSMLEPIGAPDPAGDEDELVQYIEAQEKMISKLKHLK